MKNLLKAVMLSACSFLFFTSSYAQLNDEQVRETNKNIISLGIPGLFLGNVNLGYERVISSSNSIALHGSVFIPRAVDFSATFGDETTDFTEFTEEVSSNLDGYSIVAEYRFYPGDKGAPQGFYVAPFVRRNQFELDLLTSYDGVETQLDASLQKTGFGLQLGAQWVSEGNVTLDWYFLGLSIDRNTFLLDFSSNDPNVDFTNVQEEIEQDAADFPIYGNVVSISSGADFIRAKASVLGLGFRSGLTIGYSF